MSNMTRTPESFEIVGLITKRSVAGNDDSSLNERSPLSKRKRKPVERAGAINSETAIGDVTENLGASELDLGIDDMEFTLSSSQRKISCICKKSSKSQFMVPCYGCKSFYHGKCISIDRSYYIAISQAGDVWLCPICASIDTGKDQSTFITRGSNNSAKLGSSKKSPSDNSSLQTENSNEDRTPSLESTEIVCETVSTLNSKEPVLNVVVFKENDILARLSALIPNDTTNCGNYHLFSNPSYVPKLNECLSFISKAKRKEIPFCLSPPSKEIIKGGYIYVFKSENEFLENATNEGEWSIRDGLTFNNLVLKKFPISSSEITIVERIETNLTSGFKRRAVWLSSDTSTIVVNYIGNKDYSTEDKNVELVVLDNEKEEIISLDTPSIISFPNSANKKLLSLPPGITIIPESSLPKAPATPKKSIEVVEILSDGDDINSEVKTVARRKKRLQYTPKRSQMPNLPPKQSECLKYRRKICTEFDEGKELDNSQDKKVDEASDLIITNIKSLITDKKEESS